MTSPSSAIELPVAPALSWKGTPVDAVTLSRLQGFLSGLRVGGIVLSKAPSGVHPFARISLPAIYAIGAACGQVRIASYSGVLTPSDLLERLSRISEEQAIVAVEYQAQLLPVIGVALYQGNHLVLIPAGRSIHLEAGQIVTCSTCGQPQPN